MFLKYIENRLIPVCRGRYHDVHVVLDNASYHNPIPEELVYPAQARKTQLPALWQSAFGEQWREIIMTIQRTKHIDNRAGERKVFPCTRIFENSENEQTIIGYRIECDKHYKTSVKRQEASAYNPHTISCTLW